MDKRQQAVQEAGGPTALCSRCGVLDFNGLGFQKANDYSNEKWRLSLTLGEAIASAGNCWVCAWLVYIADSKDIVLNAKIRVGFDSDRIDTLEPQTLPYNDQNRQTCVNRAVIWVDRRDAGGEFEYKGFIQRAGTTPPVDVSNMINSGNLAQAEPYTARLRPPKADIRLYRYWKDYCMKEHVDSCGLNQHFSTERFSNMKSIRLVDVVDYCIVTLKPSEDVSWVALSYVWGEEQKYALKKDNLASYHQPGALKAENFPLSITDAITVAREMDERFLWVDSLCIIQDDQEDKVQYIPAMDIIYGYAVFVIINAAVDKVSSAIPGIREASARTVQDVFEINGIWLTVSLDPPHNQFDGYLQNSKWSTRGWTYQECLIPRRCLIFTQEQAYWQCLSASLCEDMCWENRTKGDPIMYRHFLGKNVIYRVNMRSLLADRKNPWSGIFVAVLEKFLPRQLATDSDRLDALTGILRVFEHSWGQRFFWGMPRSLLEFSLAWTGGENLRRNTARQAIASGGVSSPFPSWSWAGWVGSVTMDITSVHSLIGLLPLKFYHLDRDGKPKPILDDFDGMVAQYHKDTIAKLGSDASRLPRYPNPCTHTWMDTTRTEVEAADVPRSVLASEAVPAILCFWTSTAILNIHQEPHPNNPSRLSTTISDGKTTIFGFWGWNPPRFDVKQGKFIVIGGAVERPTHGGRLLLNLMLVDEDDFGICYRRFTVSQALESSWEKMETRKWEMICLA
ncbi:heterokaryon incompatibility protein-domain-containing protein [Xylariales sp. PMI_506]|nr:heterokaryon incompatibility protein-domain-containing protein [Xylariales sp. PMI_506]